ncbi:MAG: cell division protein FtsA [Candidatus Buchananbacteria bacterium RIFCSPLOWO2_01_FULL_46_12]|uniref:Cell division protein FtsA n=1 Tax=Candidatus Buchananbacteria bacterium RIFCSPLOWO2_01_FULL_46_12 TaxID=1797546 RepID=A0A1G1YSF0_9BACT|nr:MAG: cell division protein FtsA [Candidatus Buchananbacteria bacterium RIFCSPLOWO2_01_FULL_46_12]
MAEQEMIAGLDIGSTEVRLAVGQRTQNPQEMIHIIGAAQVPAEGINRGVISSIEDAVSSISACLDKAERMIGSPVNSVWVGISGSHIISQQSQGTVAVARSDGEISEDDIERAIEAARTVATPPNYEILHVIPKSFVVDGQVGIKDPLGMTGVRLEVATQIIQGLSAQIKNLTKAVYRTGVEIEDLVLSILATAEAVLGSRQKDLGVVVINIGGSTTSLVVFEEGDIIHTAVLPIGSDHITSDIAIGLRIAIETAEKIKLEYGCAASTKVGKRDEIDLAEFEGGETNFISKKYVAEIIEARVEEIFDKVDAELKKIDRSGKLPAGIVLTGGGAKLPELVESAKKRLRLPASIGQPTGVVSAIDKINDPAFTTALGLVLWGNQLSAQQSKGFFGTVFKKLPNFKSVSNQAKKWFKKIIP